MDGSNKTKQKSKCLTWLYPGPSLCSVPLSLFLQQNPCRLGVLLFCPLVRGQLIKGRGNQVCIFPSIVVPDATSNAKYFLHVASEQILLRVWVGHTNRTRASRMPGKCPKLHPQPSANLTQKQSLLLFPLPSFSLKYNYSLFTDSLLVTFTTQ